MKFSAGARTERRVHSISALPQNLILPKDWPAGGWKSVFLVLVLVLVLVLEAPTCRVRVPFH